MTATVQFGVALSEREHAVWAFLGAGLQTKHIAFELDIEETTVKAHITAINAKLGVTNRTQAALKFHGVKLDEVLKVCREIHAAGAGKDAAQSEAKR